MINYHIHTNLSDGKNTHIENLQKAIELNLSEIGFSDHLCLKFPKWAVQKEDFDLMRNEILTFKSMTNIPINVKFGLEVDYFSGEENEISRLINLFPVDYVIGSVHYINDWNFDTNIDDYKGKDIDQLYINYFELIQKAASSGLFDIMGHIDVVKKFSFYPSFNLISFYEKTAKVFSAADIVIELNTSGLDKPCREFYPADAFLKICFNNNVPVTLGSDSHKINDLDRYYPDAISKLKLIGYNKLAVFESRKRTFVNL